MAKKTNDAAADAAPAKSYPAFVILADDWREHRAGKVLPGDPDLLSAADVEGAKYREATALERKLGGFVD